VFIFTVIPIPEFSKGRFGAVAILYDVTDFARLDELRTEVIGVASHELKTPLTTLRMNLMLLAEKADNLTVRQHEILDTAMLGCQQLADTIDELLDLTRIEAGQLLLAHETVDMRAIIERAVASLRQRYEDAAVSLRMPHHEKPALVRGDPARLGMVFTNLLSNFLKYTPSGGTVSIVILSEQDVTNGHIGLVHIAVTDTGAGIPEEFRDRVFDKFFRVESHIEAIQAGTWGSGIGLYLCRQIVEAHGGKIFMRRCREGSRNPNRR
jgi:NtrC-family two-component system sensor histidine kinase KinB